MDISDLVVIGRLGRQEPDGFYCVQFSQAYQALFNQFQECFLIFNSHRVFFVTVSETKTSKQRKYLCFLEDGIAEECAKSKTIEIALALEDLSEVTADDDIKGLFGYQVIYRDEAIGKVTDAMIHQLQSVLIIELLDGAELLVPNVMQYILSVDKIGRSITMQNLELLLELCRSTS